ncbi:hypothetical protein FA15DRAFT_737720, partial [Coprinopsis marcescibilis]
TPPTSPPQTTSCVDRNKYSIASLTNPQTTFKLFINPLPQYKMVQISTTLVLGALAIAPTLAAPITFPSNKVARDTELETRAPRGRGARQPTGVSSGLGQLLGQQATQQLNARISEDTVEVEAREPRRARGGSGRQPTGISSGIGQILGQQLNARELESADVETREPRRGGRSSGASGSAGRFVGGVLNGINQRAFEEEVELQVRQPRRGGRSSGASNSAGRFVGGVLNGLNQREFEEEVELQVRQPGRSGRSSGARSNSAGRFVGGVLNQREFEEMEFEAREFEEYMNEAREFDIEELD